MTRTGHEERSDYILKNIDNYPFLSDEEITEMLDGKTYLTIPVAKLTKSDGSYSNGRWFVLKYENNKKKQLATISDLGTTGKYELSESKGDGYSYSVQDNQIVVDVSLPNSPTSNYSVQKLKDGYYLINNLNARNDDYSIYAESDALGNVLYPIEE